MKNILQKIFIFIIIIIFICSFSSSYNSLNIDNLAFVVALGIDKSDTNNIKVTFQFVNPPATSEGSSQDSKIIIDTVDASSITNAINIMNSYLARKLDLSHCKIIVFSEEIAQDGISDYIYSIMNDVQVRPSSNIIVSNCSANYYIENSVPSLETLVTKYYDTFPNSSKYTGYITNATIGYFFNSLVCEYCQGYAILGGITSDNNKSIVDSDIKSGSSNITGTRKSENIGTAIFKDDKLVGELNAIETVCLSILTNDVESFLITIPDPKNENSTLDIYMLPEKDMKIDVKIVNGSPYITIKGEFSAQIYSMSENSKYLDNDVLSLIGDSCSNYLKSILSDFLYKTSLTYKSDVAGIGRYVLQKFRTNQDFTDYNWASSYVNSTFDIKIDTKMDSGFLLTQT